VLDEPGPRKVHERPMPRVGGIAMAVGAAMAVLLWVPMDRSLAAVLLAALTILVFGVWDDRSNLPARTKFSASASPWRS
jgi:UDP-GlcNAc:undecaprenyl-phosphate/decaprenyl-phosphate GlcNAc-1-phosphate transferase